MSTANAPDWAVNALLPLPRPPMPAEAPTPAKKPLRDPKTCGCRAALPPRPRGDLAVSRVKCICGREFLWSMEDGWLPSDDPVFR